VSMTPSSPVASANRSRAVGSMVTSGQGSVGTGQRLSCMQSIISSVGCWLLSCKFRCREPVHRNVHIMDCKLLLDFPELLQCAPFTGTDPCRLGLQRVYKLLPCPFVVDVDNQYIAISELWTLATPVPWGATVSAWIQCSTRVVAQCSTCLIHTFARTRS
jgi:hypothetical protein